MNIDFKNLTISKAHDMLVNKEITVRDLVFAYLDNAKKINKEINAFIEFFDIDTDFEQKITRAQQMINEGTSHMLTGIPYGIKDNILTKGHIASAGSMMLKNYYAAYSSTAIERLNTVGAILIGRTNMDDAAMGSSTESSVYGVTKNPHDVTKVPGGSSGGSAAAVAANMCLFALGTDTGGSVRQPAAFCGVVGMYPTYGTVSRSGIIAMGSSLDQIGPLAKTVGEVSIVLDTIKGQDVLDATTLTDDSIAKLRVAPIKKVIGVPRHFLEMEGIDREVKTSFEESLEKFKSYGYEIRDIELPNAHLGLAAYYIVMPAEVSSNLSRYDGMKYGLSVREGNDLLQTYLQTRHDGFGPEPRRRIMLGTYVLSAGYYDAYYNKATNMREVIKQDFQKVFDSGVDIVLTPTTPSTAFGFNEKSDPLSMYLADIFTVTNNLSHMPGISIPSGADSKGLPFGIQLTANHGREDVLFAIAEDFEKHKSAA